MCFLISKFEETLFRQLAGFNEVDENSDGTEAETFTQVAATADFSAEGVYGEGSRQSIVGTIQDPYAAINGHVRLQTKKFHCRLLFQ